MSASLVLLLLLLSTEIGAAASEGDSVHPVGGTQLYASFEASPALEPVGEWMSPSLVTCGISCRRHPACSEWSRQASGWCQLWPQPPEISHLLGPTIWLYGKA